jgi:catechol 2,3-dioxygenase-like lactoylglutathione lyase family enzyme
MEQRISLVTLGVRDLAASRAFYQALGWSDDGARQPHSASGTPLVGMRRELRPSQ